MKKTGIITAGSLLIPSFLRAESMIGSTSVYKGKRIVIIQLSGGNDGLNTVIPYGLDPYYQNRSLIGVTENNLLKLDDKFGLNPKLLGLYDLQKRGLLSVINSIGYPNPNRSHFRSMDIWHAASDSNQYLQSGWIGRYLDANCEHAYEGIEINGSLSLAMKGDRLAGIALKDPQAFYKTIESDFYADLKVPKTDNAELDYLYKVFNDTKDSAEYIFDQYRLKENKTVYEGRFGQQLKKIATLIKSDMQTPVYYTQLGGFDTHVNQLVMQGRLLEELDQGITTFVKDLETDGLLKDTTVFVFSEFGRRLKENASKGTDHGAANVAFVIDGNLNTLAHTYNQIDLADLENGDPKFKVDFRSVYQELLSHKLQVDSKLILNKDFPALNLFT